MYLSCTRISQSWQDHGTKFVIYNALGEKVLTGNLNFGKNEISTDMLLKGVYHIEFYDIAISLGKVKFIKMN